MGVSRHLWVMCILDLVGLGHMNVLETLPIKRNDPYLLDIPRIQRSLQRWSRYWNVQYHSSSRWSRTFQKMESVLNTHRSNALDSGVLSILRLSDSYYWDDSLSLAMSPTKRGYHVRYQLLALSVGLSQLSEEKGLAPWLEVAVRFERDLSLARKLLVGDVLDIKLLQVIQLNSFDTLKTTICDTLWLSILLFGSSGSLIWC